MKKAIQWHIYILRCADKTLYTGITTDLDKRLKCHQSGKASKYTRSRLPVKMIWTEGDHTESSAKKREAEIKKLSRLEKLKIIKRCTKKVVKS
jgi:putative endonuclease